VLLQGEEVNDSIHRVPSAIHLYEEGDLEGVDLQQLGHSLTEKTHIPCHLHGNIYHGLSPKKEEEVARGYAGAKVKNPEREVTHREPLPGEWKYEQRRIRDPRWKLFGILYDGVTYHRIISDLILGEGIDLDHCAILFTNQLFGTWDWNDRRYHARVSLYGFPSLISTSGLVEAPAKPKEFYFKKQMGVPVELLKEEYKGQFIDQGDLRTTEVLKGYAFQALFFHLSGDPFCEDQDCRLFNSHWQEEVIRAQIDGKYEFCPRHERILRELRERSKDSPSPSEAVS
jgi:hypothetical protein